MQLNSLVATVRATLSARQARQANPTQTFEPPSIPFRFLSTEEQRVKAEHDAFNAKVSTRQVRRRLTRPWKQRATT